MQPLPQIESFVRSAESGSFSAAARLLGLSPAAVSKNVARLEASLGLRLFQRSTRKLVLTEGGARLLADIGGSLSAIADALEHAADAHRQPSGTLKVSMGQAFGRSWLLPLLGDFLRRYPLIVPDWRFENRQVDLVGEGYDAGIGGGLALAPGLVSRELGQVHIVAVAAPAYMAGQPLPTEPADLAQLDGIVRRSPQSGRLLAYELRDAQGRSAVATPRRRIVFDDPEAICQAAVQGLGVALLPMPFARPWLQSGALLRLLPGWWRDGGATCIYWPERRLLPLRTRVFVDFVVEEFGRRGFAKLVRGD